MRLADIPIPELARVLARELDASIVLLQIKRTGPGSMVCEDAGSLKADDGPEAVLVGMCAALEGMLANARRELAAVRERRR